MNNQLLTRLELKMYKLIYDMFRDTESEDRVVVQHQLGKYRLDFAIPTLKIAIECEESDIWSTDRVRIAMIEARDEALASIGWATLRFSRDYVESSPGAVKDEIATIVADRRERAG